MKWKSRISSLKERNYTRNEHPGKKLQRSKTANVSFILQNPKLGRNI